MREFFKLGFFISLAGPVTFKNAKMPKQVAKNIPLNKLLFITGMNHKYEGGGFKFGPEANNHDGMLEICAVTRISKLKILFSLPKAYNGSHFEVDGIDHYRVRSYTVRVSEPLYVHADGEVDAKADFISVYLDQEALHMIY